MRSSLLGGSVLAFAVLATSPTIPCVISYSDEELSDDLAEVGDQIELLWSGTEEERWAIALAPWPRFAPWDRPVAPEDRPLLVEQVDSLRRWILVESDDGIVRGVLARLAYVNLRELRPLFREALDHPSPNVRWIAIERFVRFPDPQALPALLALWRGEPRERLRVDLALALAAHRHSEARVWRSWLADPRPTITEAGLRALAAVADERALPAVLQLAAEADHPLRAAAVGLLPQWGGPDAVVEAALSASTEGGEVGARAAVALARLDDPRAADRLIELLSENPARVPGVFAVLENSPGASSRKVLDRLEAAFSEIVSDLRELGIGAAEETEREASVPREDGSGIEPLHRDPAYDGSWRVRGPAGSASVRCFSRPEVGLPAAALYGRIPDGTAFDRVLDVFERDDVTWLSIRKDWRVCWIPESQAESRDAGDDPGIAPSDSAALEFDVPIEELSSRSFGELEADRWIEAFDVGSDVAGVRVRDPVGDSTAVEALLGALGDGPRVLELHLVKILREVPPGDRAGNGWRTFETLDSEYPDGW